MERAAAAAAVAAVGDPYSALVREDQLDGLARATAAPTPQDSRAAVGMAVVLDSRSTPSSSRTNAKLPP